jgi:hypothetical protein
MKRFLSILLSVLMVVSVLAILASCNGDKTETTTAAQTTETTAATTTEATTTAKTDTTTTQAPVTTTAKETETTTVAPTTTATEKVTTTAEVTTVTEQVTTTAEVTTTTEEVTTTIETTTLPVFARFDFGTKTYAEDEGLTSHDYLMEILNFEETCITIYFEEDYWDVWTISAYDSSKAITEKFGQKNFSWGLMFNDLVTFDFDDELTIGYGGWNNTPYKPVEEQATPAWSGQYQYMQIRLVNNTTNNIWAVRFRSEAHPSFSTTQVISNLYLQGGEPESSTDYRRTCTATEEWATYTYDLFLTSGLSSGRGQVAWKSNNEKCDNWFDYKAYVFEVGNPGGTNLTWQQHKALVCIEFEVFSGVYMYGSDGEQWDTAAEHITQACDTRANIKAGMEVKIDYIIFGCTPEQLDAWHSYLEDA